jgi:hypothetical protein
MRIVGEYPFNDANEIIKSVYGAELAEVRSVVASINAAEYMTKASREKTMSGRMLYSPIALNRAFKNAFTPYGWKNVRVKADYTTQYYVPGYEPPASASGAFRDMDFVKNKLGVEVQFGKYAFMVYNVAAKMTIFRNLGIINAGIEIVPVKEMADDMSTGVAYFEQFLWDLEKRGISDIDIPVLILGIAP